MSDNQIVDIGVNLMHRSFHQDREQVVERAITSNVTPLILTGTSMRSSVEAARYAGRYAGKLYATAGVHPHDTKSCNAGTIAALKELAALRQVVAIGECGLDYNRDFSPREVQRRWFTALPGRAQSLRLIWLWDYTSASLHFKCRYFKLIRHSEFVRVKDGDSRLRL